MEETTANEFKPKKGSQYTYEELMSMDFKFIKETACVFFFRKGEILLTFDVDYYRAHNIYKLVAYQE